MNHNEQIDLQNQLLNLVKEMNKLDTDYKLAKYMKVPLQTIRNYRMHKSNMNSTMCTQVANELKMDPMQVIARVKLETTKNPRTQKVWEKYLGRVLLAAFFTFAQPPEINAQIQSQGFDQIYITRIRNALRRRRRRRAYGCGWLAGWLLPEGPLVDSTRFC